MADLSTNPDRNGDNDDNVGTPRWVKVFGIISLVVILIFIILMLTRGSHGPSRHTSGTNSLTPSNLASVQVV